MGVLFRRVLLTLFGQRIDRCFCMVRGRWLEAALRAATGAGVNYEEARQKIES